MNIKKVTSKRGIIALYHFLMYILIYLITRLIKKTNIFKDIWIISERGDEARDNAYHMFKYIREEHPYIKIYYLISKNSADRKKLETFGNLINFASVKHIIIYFLAEKHISTHINGFFPNEKAYNYLNNILPVNSKKVFLQHGIIKDYIKGATASNVKLDLFICGAYPEYHYVSENYGHPQSVVQYLGLARYDFLHSKKLKKQILLMPTFRMDFFAYPDDDITKEREEYFINTTYYKKYQSLLNNSILNDLLNENGLELVFYPHYEVQRYIHLFKKKSDNIIIANKNNYDVQNLLIESQLLITDYSSVYFDFAYMEKPIIYYQFDYSDYREVQYKEGYFSYVNHGFGPVIDSEHKLVENIQKLVKSNFKMQVLYRNRKKEFFLLNDEKNRKRNFEAILNL